MIDTYPIVDKQDELVQERDEAQDRYDEIQKEYDILYDEYVEEVTSHVDLKEEQERAWSAYNALVNFIVLLEPNIRKIIGEDDDPALAETFEEFAHELHRSLIARLED
jgi:hypothetical protein